MDFRVGDLYRKQVIEAASHRAPWARRTRLQAHSIGGFGEEFCWATLHLEESSPGNAMSDQTIVGGGPDWWGRLMSVGAMLIAAASLYYTYQLQQATRGVLDGNNPAVTQANFRGPLDSMISPPNEPNTDDDAMGVEEDANDSVGIRDPLADDSDTQENGGVEVDLPLTEHPPVTQLRQPELVAVRTAYRPSGDESAATVTLKNAGQLQALISEILFEPMETLELTDINAADPEWGEGDSSRLIIRMGELDNRSQTPGRIGNYVHVLPNSFQVPVGDDVDVCLAIENPKHIGYAVRGRLTFRVSNGDELIVRDVALAFVDEQ